MKAYLGDENLKKELLAEIKLHEKADALRQGTYGRKEGKKFVACAVGCAITSYNARKGTNYETNNHMVYEEQLGIPRVLAHLEDRIFEGLEAEEAKVFPHRFMSAIKPGADLSLVTPKFMVWLLADKKHGVIRFANEDGQAAIKQVVNLYKRVIAGKTVTDKEWSQAARAADTAARAAYTAADAARAADAAAYAARAAYAAAYAARAADAAAYAADAAYAAARAADTAADAAARAAYKAMADKLIELLEEVV